MCRAPVWCGGVDDADVAADDPARRVAVKFGKLKVSAGLRKCQDKQKDVLGNAKYFPVRADKGGIVNGTKRCVRRVSHTGKAWEREWMILKHLTRTAPQQGGSGDGGVRAIPRYYGTVTMHRRDLKAAAPHDLIVPKAALERAYARREAAPPALRVISLGAKSRQALKCHNLTLDEMIEGGLDPDEKLDGIVHTIGGHTVRGMTPIYRQVLQLQRTGHRHIMLGLHC